jgi:hypothetical protein
MRAGATYKHFRFNQLAKLIFVVSLLSACASLNSVSNAIDAYKSVAPTVSLGQDKEEVLAVLQPTQASLSASQSKAPESYVKEGKLTEIYFYRTRSFADGLLTDDEFTPYIFEDGTLVGIGWTLIGGPKTQARRNEQPAEVRLYGGFWF